MTNKLIKMPAETLRLWLEALRSLNFVQGTNYLRNKDNSFCCLGVLQMCIDGVTEPPDAEDDPDVVSARLPSLKWLEQNNIAFYDHIGNFRTGLLPNPIVIYTDDFGEPKQDDIATLNDSGAFSFKRLADIIEANTETTHTDVSPLP